MKNASARALYHFRKQGYDADMVERVIPHFRTENRTTTRDWLGFADLMAYHEDHLGVVAVQATTRKQVAKHIKDYRRDEAIKGYILRWLKAGNRFVIQGWDKEMVLNKKQPKSGTVKKHAVWRVKELWVTPVELRLTEQDKIAIASESVD